HLRVLAGLAAKVAASHATERYRAPRNQRVARVSEARLDDLEVMRRDRIVDRGIARLRGPAPQDWRRSSVIRPACHRFDGPMRRCCSRPSHFRFWPIATDALAIIFGRYWRNSGHR